MLEFGSGNLLNAEAEALVNTVNTVGVAGKGIALQFRQAYPDNFKAYAAACKRDEVTPGRMFVYDSGKLGDGRYVINFPTKRHWRGGSKLEDVAAGLKDLVRVLREREIKSVAIPPLGCGNGGLDWRDVLPLIEQAFTDVPEVHVIVFPPAGAPAPDEMIVRTKRPLLNPFRAAVLALFDRYLRPDYHLGALEAQKLTYFLQECGQPLHLKFVKGQYGPYTETLHHALQPLEGHYLRGYGDRTQSPRIILVPGASDEVERFLQSHPDTADKVDCAAQVIEGFETPYGLELLSTVHWAGRALDSCDVADLCSYVQAWTARKGQLFTESHVARALARLKQYELAGHRGSGSLGAALEAMRKGIQKH
jgi:O-acetyl-ADP-ribose deacetylase (regulator of RNase III)